MPRLRWVFLMAFVALASCIVGTACVFEYRKIDGLNASISELSQILAEQESSIKEYREKSDFYQTNEGIAHLARERYNLALPNERIYMLSIDSSDAMPLQ